MFDLHHAKARIIAVTAVSELHGKERVPACCVTFELTSNNLILSEFDSQLRHALYGKESAPSQQPGLDLEKEMGGVTSLKFPKMGMPLKWDWEGAGYDLILHIGASGKADIELGEIGLSDFQFTLKDCGTVLTKFKVMAHPSASEQGKIDQMLQTEVELSLLPPESTQQEMAA